MRNMSWENNIFQRTQDFILNWDNWKRLFLIILGILSKLLFPVRKAQKIYRDRISKLESIKVGRRRDKIDWMQVLKNTFHVVSLVLLLTLLCVFIIVYSIAVYVFFAFFIVILLIIMVYLYPIAAALVSLIITYNLFKLAWYVMKWVDEFFVELSDTYKRHKGSGKRVLK